MDIGAGVEALAGWHPGSGEAPTGALPPQLPGQEVHSLSVSSVTESSSALPAAGPLHTLSVPRCLSTGQIFR